MKKNFINFALAALVAFGTVAYTGCGKKGCTVEADDAFDSAATEADPEACDASATAAKFASVYQVAETCGTTPDAYSITITASNTTDYTISISNLFDAGEVTTATVSQSNLTIDAQTFDIYSISGTGNLSGNTITINFTITGGTSPYSCVVTGDKL